jgi:tRNA pseudouridine13 synthase
LKPRGRIKAIPEDFRVDELPLYEPCGSGEHLFVRFEKRDLTTDAAARAIAGALGVAMPEVGIAGMKDRRAVTTQTISLLAPRADSAFDERALALSIDGVKILSARRHTNKLKTGHLAGNRFAIVIRDLGDGAPLVISKLTELGRTGLPNAFGPQRFGRAGDNAEHARAWLSGRIPAPRDPRLRRLHWSALQAELFNALLAARVEGGTWDVPLEGDLVKRRASGGLFSCTDVQAERERARVGEVSPTGPIFGAKMRWPRGAPEALERRILGERLGDGFDLAANRSLGEGTRRALRLWVDQLQIECKSMEEAPSLRVYFVLPKGAYATTVLGAAIELSSEKEKEPEDE